MSPKRKYDIAISVAEEDLAVAQQIGAALKKRRIAYFLYTEHRARNWGKRILEISLDTYGAEANYVLMITSKTFAEKYWTNLERQIGEVFNKRRKPNILQLRIDDTPIDGLSKHVVSERWYNNPEEIAGIIEEKLRQERRRKSGWIFFPVVIILAVMFLVNNINSCNHIPVDEQGIRQGDTGRVKQPSAKPGTILKNKSLIYTDSTMQVHTVARPVKMLIKGRAFTMGNSSGASDEQPAHVVRIASFYMSKTEVTVEQYSQYCSSQGKAVPLQYSHRFLSSCPVVNISWDEAAAYCKWAGGRLPTEAEWEYAAGAGLPVKYAGGNNAGKVAVYRNDKPRKVATLEANDFGLYDMTGNVAEWCSDWFDAGYYTASERDNPRGPSTGKEKVVRGGAYNNEIKPVNQLGITRRSKESPDSGKPYIGFRVAWDK